MSRAESIALVVEEIERATIKWKGWPSDPVHAAGVVSEEAGELMQAAMNHTYMWKDKRNMLTEAIHTAAMAIRFIEAYQAGHYDKRPDSLPEIAKK